MPFADVPALLRAAGVPFTLHEHPPLRTAQENRDHLPFPPDAMLKTVAFQIKQAGWVLVAVGGAERVDYRRLAAALGVKRGQIVQPPPEMLEGELGFQVGGVCPVPPGPGILVVLDTQALAMDTIYCGSGRNDLTIQLTMRDLLQLVQPIIAPVVLERDSAGPGV